MKYIMAAAIALLMSSDVRAEDNNQSDIRENPTVELGNVLGGPDYPSYINLTANHINLNGADWSQLPEIFAAADSCPITIVHIGDSHLQADMGTAVTRNRLGSTFGHLRGRGLIIPFKLAGTNQPVDYQVTSTTPMGQARLLKTPWGTKMGFSGIGIEPQRRNFDLTITTAESFDALTIYYTGDTLEILSALVEGLPVPYYASGVYKGMHLMFPDNFTSITLNLKAPAGTAIHGVNCSAGDTGLAYHVIGNNGATFGTYTGIGTVGEDVAEMFEPDMIILSLGCNEAFNNMTSADFRKSIDTLVKEIQDTNPEVPLLLVTPQECHRKVTSRRRRRRSTTSFAVNNDVKRMREIILSYAADNNIPVYDWYEVSGGAGSSHKWIADRNINTDHIHLTRSGYQLQGNLFTDALLEVLR